MNCLTWFTFVFVLLRCDVECCFGLCVTPMCVVCVPLLTVCSFGCCLLYCWVFDEHAVSTVLLRVIDVVCVGHLICCGLP